MKLRELKKGEFFTKKPIEEPKENQIWIKDSYDRSTKKWLCYSWADVNRECLIDGNKEVFTEFVF